MSALSRVVGGLAVGIVALALSAPAVHAGPLQGASTLSWWDRGSTARGYADVAGDLDGDGYDDMAFGQESTVLIAFGSRGSVNRDIEDQRAGVYTLTVPDLIGNVGSAGDFDGDGHDDLIIGAGAKAFVFYGAAAPLVGSGSLMTSGRVTTITGTSSKLATNRPPQGVGIGDFDGDGRSDIAMGSKNGGIAIVHGGARVATIDANGKNARTSVIASGQDCRVMALFIPYCEWREAIASAVGDINGDGRADLAVDASVLSSGGRRSVMLGRAGTFSTTAASPSNAFEIPRAGGMPVRVGDLNGDGKDELHQPGFAPPNDPTASRYVLGTATPPASLDFGTAPSIDIAGGYDARAVGDQDGDGRRDIAVLSFSGPLSTDVYRDGGEARLLTAPTGAGVINAAGGTVVKGLPVAKFLGAANPDFDGDGLVDLVTTMNDVKRSPGSPWRNRLFLIATHGADILAPYLTDASISPASFRPSEGATISVTAEESDTTVEIAYVPQFAGGGSTVTERCTLQRGANALRITGTVNGVRLPAGAYVAQLVPIDPAGNRGPTRPVSFTLVGEPEPASDLPRSVADLKRSGDAALLSDGSLMLTNGDFGSVGTGVFPLKRDYNGRTVEFETTFLGDGVEGMTMAFITTEADAGGQWLGRGGQQLGFAGLGGIAVGLDASKGLGDPSDNFVGWSVGPLGSGLQWVQTNDPGVNLRAGATAVKVKVVMANKRAQVYVNGVLKMDRALLAPPKSRLALTASSSAGAFVEVTDLKVT